MSAASGEADGARASDPVKARQYIQFLIDVAQTVDPDGVGSEDALYELQFDSGIGLVTWVRTAEELLAPNGLEPLLVWMLRETEARRSPVFRLERLPEDGSGRSTVQYQRWASALTRDFLPSATESNFSTSSEDLAVLAERVKWVSALADAAHFAQDELVQLQLGLTQRAKREAERAQEQERKLERKRKREQGESSG